jgi:hypothetical protein
LEEGKILLLIVGPFLRSFPRRERERKREREREREREIVIEKLLVLAWL